MTAEPIVDNRDEIWYWDEADPKVRAVVGGLGGGMVTLPGLVMEAAKNGFGIDHATITAASGGQIPETVMSKLPGPDPSVPTLPELIVAEVVIDRLIECEPEERGLIIRELGRLAGNNNEAVKLAEQANGQIAGGNKYQAMPSLKSLSSLALGKLGMWPGYELFLARRSDKMKPMAFKNTILGRRAKIEDR